MCLVIRADATVQIGTGHLMRCLALSQAWQLDGGQSIFVMASEAPACEARLQSEGMEIVHLSNCPGSDADAIQTADYACHMNASWVVLDGDHFGATYQRIMKESKLRLLVIDDNGHAEHYYADIVLNQNLHGREGMYVNKEPYTELLLGTRYVLLRQEFLRRREEKKAPKVANKLLVTLGGSDPNNVTLKVIRALQQGEICDMEITVIVGGSNPHLQELQSAIRDSRLTIRLESNVTNMSALMAWADMAISSASCTSLELAFMGVPTLLLELAPNQHYAAEGLDTARVAINLGRAEHLSSSAIAREIMRLQLAMSKREEMAQRGRQLVDGKGTHRTLLHMKSADLRIRKTRENDSKLLWKWANDQEVRAASFSSEPVPWKQHAKWFESKLRDPNCIFYVITNEDGTPIGQIRYDITGSEAIASISLDTKFRGRGYGSASIWLSSRELFDISGVTLIHAYTKQANEASIHAFMRAGFSNVGKTIFRGNEAVHLVLRTEKPIT